MSNTEDKFYIDLQGIIKVAREPEMRFKSAEELLLEYIRRFYHHDYGEIVPIGRHRAAAMARDYISCFQHNMRGDGVGGDWKTMDCNKSIFWIGEANLKNDIDWSNPDPYPTAGGYMTGIARKNQKVLISVIGTFQIQITGMVNILVDHYNNNFCGVSTGGGTTRYAEGERVESKTILRGQYIQDVWKHLEDIHVDFENLVRIIEAAE